jgi:hypothetical protein
MKRSERLKENLAKVKGQLMALYRAGNFTQTRSLEFKIKILEAQIEEAEAYEPRKLAELIDKETLEKHKIAEKMVALHLAADFLTDCGHDLKDTLNALGLEGCSLFPLVDEIRKKASDFAALVCHPEFAGLSDFMVNNEEYIDECHRVTEDYIHKHLEIT